MKSYSSHLSVDLTLILAIQATFLLATFFNIMLLRWLLGLVLLTFVSGFLILRLTKLDGQLGLVNTVLLSVGLSVSFDMFLGLFANFALPLVGIGRPLDEIPLLIVFNLSLILILLASQLRETKSGFDPRSIFSVRTLLFAVFLPVLGIAGSVYAATSNNGLLLLALDLAIIIVLCLSILGSKFSKFFALIIIVIAVALLFRGFFLSRYFWGYDEFTEYYVFTHLNSSGYWNQSLSWSQNVLGNRELLKANSMLSVTILPQVYSQTLGIDPTSTFKLLYPLIAVFILLGLYSLYCTQLSKIEAFLSVFFFISVVLGIGGLGPDKQIVAIFFYVLIFFLFFNKELVSWGKYALLIVFGASIVVSHYTVSYLLIFLIFMVWFVFFALKIRAGTRAKPRRISLVVCILFLVMAFSWYIFVSGSGPFNDFVKVLNNIYSNFATDFFNPSSRTSMVLTGVGLESAPSPLHQIGRYVFFIAEALIILGLFKLIIQRKKLKFDPEFMALIVFNFSILVMTIVVPLLAGSIGEQRFYEIACVFLSPMAILGIKAVSEIGQKLWKRSTFIGLALIVLVVFFMFQSEFVYAITGNVTYTVEMSMYNPDINSLYGQFVWQGDVVGGQWLSHYTAASEKSTVFSDVYSDALYSTTVLTAFCGFNGGSIQLLSNTTLSLQSGSDIYLGLLNIHLGIMDGEYYQFRTTDVSTLLNSTDKVYSNGYCEIYHSP
jgi:uncharacterized membrane protein